MKTINTKLGVVYLEEWEYDRHCPAIREDEDFVKIFDSNERCLDSWEADTIEELAEDEGVTPQEWLAAYEKKIKSCDTITELLDAIGVDYDLVTDNRKQVVEFLLDCNVDDDSPLEQNEWVNIIGKHYIVIAEC